MSNSSINNDKSQSRNYSKAGLLQNISFYKFQKEKINHKTHLSFDYQPTIKYI